MGASITLAGESLIAQKQAARQTVEVSTFILAKVPGLDTTLPVDRAAGVPQADQIVHTTPVTREGYLATNKVVYSLMLGTDVGDFDFNWMGLVTAEGVLLIAAYVPLQQKRREIPPLQAGNNLTRNIVWEYDGAQSLSGITVPASTWQFDFTADFTAINAKLAELKTELDKKVDLTTWTPPQAVSLDGPVLVYPGSTNTYKITDYNRFSLFTAATTVGTVTIAADVLTLTIPANAPAGLMTLDVLRDGNKASFRLPVGEAAIVPPTITSPVNLAAGVALDLVLTATPFEVYPAGFDHQVSRRWQIATDEAFTQLVFDKTSTTDLTSIHPSEYDFLLPPGKRLYARAFDIGATLQSAAPTAISFNTATTYIRKPAITYPTDGQLNVSPYAPIRSDAFNVYGGADTHIASRWQYSTQSNFATILIDSGWVTDQLTSYLPVNVPQKTMLYSRVKYKGQVLGETEWSTGVQYTTADQLKGTFTGLTSGGLARYYHSGIAIGVKLYIQGGIPGATPVGRDDTWEYDTDLGTCTQRASYLKSYGHTAVAYGNKMYLYGGSNDGAYYSSIRLFNPATNGWSSLAPSGSIPPARSLHFTVVIGNKMYMGGGGDNTNSFKDFWVFDFTTSKWASLAALPVAVSGSAVTYGGMIYVFAFTGAVYVYDPATDIWSVKKTGIKRYLSPGVLMGTKVYFFGGTDGTVSANADLWFYDILADAWLKVTSGASARSGHALVNIGDKLYMYAGHYNGYAKNDLWRIE